MSSTRDYIDYLNAKTDIAPANSQEELDEARLIQKLMEQHGLETQLQEFEANGAGDIPHAVALFVLFIGTVLAGIIGAPVQTLGLILVFICLILFVVRFALGRDVLAGLGGRARSQNVIGVHRADGPLVTKGNRPIVIMAHYDTPNENFLYQEPFAAYQAFLRRLSPDLAIVVFICCFVQVLVFLPEPIRRVFWIVGIIACAPLVLIGISYVYERFSPCTTGANDNKASVAALLGVLDSVRPGPDDAKRYAAEHPFVEDEEQAGESVTDGASAEPEEYEDENEETPDSDVPAAVAPAEEDDDVIADTVLRPAVASTSADMPAEQDVLADEEGSSESEGAYIPGGYDENGQVFDGHDEDVYGAYDAAPDDGGAASSVAGRVRGLFGGLSARIRGLRGLGGSGDQETAFDSASDNVAEPSELDQESAFDRSQSKPRRSLVSQHRGPAPTVAAAPRGEAADWSHAQAEDDRYQYAETAPSEDRAWNEDEEPQQESEPRTSASFQLDLDRPQRHGLETIESLDMLPEDCEVVYRKPAIRRARLAQLPKIEEQNESAYQVEREDFGGAQDASLQQEPPYAEDEQSYDQGAEVLSNDDESYLPYEPEGGYSDEAQLSLAERASDIAHRIGEWFKRLWTKIVDEITRLREQLAERKAEREQQKAEAAEHAELERLQEAEGSEEVEAGEEGALQPQDDLIEAEECDRVSDEARVADESADDADDAAAESITATSQREELLEHLPTIEEESPAELDSVDETAGTGEGEIPLAHQDEAEQTSSVVTLDEVYPFERDEQDQENGGDNDELDDLDYIDLDDQDYLDEDLLEDEEPLEEPASQPSIAQDRDAADATVAGTDSSDSVADTAEFEKPAAVTSVAEGLVFSEEQDISEEELEQKDATGLDTLSIDGVEEIPEVAQPKPRPIDDPNWGRSEFRPSASLARRAALFDLPNPATNESVDPFANVDDAQEDEPQESQGVDQGSYGLPDTQRPSDTEQSKESETEAADLEQTAPVELGAQAQERPQDTAELAASEDALAEGGLSPEETARLTPVFSTDDLDVTKPNAVVNTQEELPLTQSPEQTGISSDVDEDDRHEAAEETGSLDVTASFNVERPSDPEATLAGSAEEHAEVPADADQTDPDMMNSGLETVGVGEPQPLETLSADSLQPTYLDEPSYGFAAPSHEEIGGRKKKKNKGGLRGLFSRKKKNDAAGEESISDWLGVSDDYDAKKDGRAIGSWSNFEQEAEKLDRQRRDGDSSWKGGAAMRSNLRVVADDEDLPIDEYGQVIQPAQPSEEEMRDQILHMGDDELICHDIYFVAVGSNGLGNSGAAAFIDQYRRDIRGCFLINLDSIGAGELTLLTKEGLDNPRRADRRMVRMLSGVFDDLHLPFQRRSYEGASTDATYAMRSRIRATTIMGQTNAGIRAQSHVVDDEPSGVDRRQVSDVAEVVAEFIRRA